MSFPDISADLRARMPELRGRLTANAPLAPYTWFRVGGPAQILFRPEDETDLAYFLSLLPEDIPITVLGAGSNVIVRDGGVPGVVIRLGRGFGQITLLEDHGIRVGAVVPDMRLAMAAAKAGIAGLAFYRGIPGTVGGALRMNAGAHGGETADVCETVVALDRAGNRHVLSREDMGFAYRKSAAPTDYIFVAAEFRGKPGDPEVLAQEMADITAYREDKQPIRSRTGGSTFKNPPGHSAWRLIDAAGCRGLRLGGVHVSEKHCNFLINDGEATAAEIEALGETVRRRVKETSGVDLQWEIRIIGIPREEMVLAP